MWQSMVCTVWHEEMWNVVQSDVENAALVWCSVEMCSCDVQYVVVWCIKHGVVTLYCIPHRTTPHSTCPFHITWQHTTYHMVCSMWWCDVAKHGVYCVNVECSAVRCGIMLLRCCDVAKHGVYCVNVECCAVRCGIMLLRCCDVAKHGALPISHSTSHHTTSCTIPYHKTMWWCDVTKHGAVAL